jgi:hypothetical protein
MKLTHSLTVNHLLYTLHTEFLLVSYVLKDLLLLQEAIKPRSLS